MEPKLAALILARLTAGDDVDDAVADLVLAACDGQEALERVLEGGPAAPAPETADDGELELIAPGAYLVSIEVEGFRGIAAPAKLELSPGPGLTLVTGRNGSGKSSFAEGLELLMTGVTERWKDRPRVWAEGWQNLHASGETRIAAEVHVDGEPGTTTIRGRWERDAAPADGDVAVNSRAGATTLEERGWAVALERYRPFLSYNELAAMFDSSTGVYDTLHRILGLEDIDELARTLRDARLERDRQAKASKAGRDQLIGALAEVEDERAAIVRSALEGRKVDLDTVELTLDGYAENANAEGELAVLRHARRDGAAYARGDRLRVRRGRAGDRRVRRARRRRGRPRGRPREPARARAPPPRRARRRQRGLHDLRHPGRPDRRLARRRARAGRAAPRRVDEGDGRARRSATTPSAPSPR